MRTPARHIVRAHLRGQAGYLWEVPILALLIVVVTGVLAPLIPPPWNIVPMGVAIVAIIGFLLYNFFFAGWLPRGK